MSTDTTPPIAQDNLRTGNPAPDYGEPWQYTSFRNCIRDRHHVLRVIEDDLRNRSRSCVNACAGMADPAAEIQAMREAMTEAAEQLSGFLGFHAEALSLDQVRALSATLAKLQPFTTPGA